MVVLSNSSYYTTCNTFPNLMTSFKYGDLLNSFIIKYARNDNKSDNYTNSKIYYQKQHYIYNPNSSNYYYSNFEHTKSNKFIRSKIHKAS